MSGKIIKIVFSVILQDAGEATRAIEIATGLQQYNPGENKLEIIFLSHGSPFEQRVLENGFTIYKCSPSLPGIGFHHDLKTTQFNIIGDEGLVSEMLEGEIKALDEIEPDFVLYGFWPIAGLARRMTKKVIPGISYLPIPFLREPYSTTLMKDVPDIIKPLTVLPKPVRKKIFSIIPKSMKLKAPILQQSNILKVLKLHYSEFGSVNDIFDMLEADFTIINDFEEFYTSDKLPETVKVVGPLYAPANTDKEVDKEIIETFRRPEGKVNIFCSLGSSGKKEFLFEVIKAVKERPEWNAVILAPKAVCPIKDAQALAANSRNIYLTDSFVPAPLVNKMADIVISHGGQGTVQTAIASGTPIVGYAMQPEQQINLDNIVMRKAGIRIPIHKWKSGRIQKSVTMILNNPEYSTGMTKLQSVINNAEGKKNASLALWDYISSQL